MWGCYRCIVSLGRWSELIKAGDVSFLGWSLSLETETYTGYRIFDLGHKKSHVSSFVNRNIIRIKCWIPVQSQLPLSPAIWYKVAVLCFVEHFWIRDIQSILSSFEKSVNIHMSPGLLSVENLYNLDLWTLYWTSNGSNLYFQNQKCKLINSSLLSWHSSLLG